MPYDVVFSRTALKELRKIAMNEQDILIQAAEALAENPRPDGCKKLKGNNGYYRIRVGDYRIIYDIQDDILYIEILHMKHRKDAYD
jgi:mRNA interferase RelE/StbE